MLIKKLSVLLIAILISACAQTKYHWGGYENALYRYYKSPVELENLAEELADVIAQGERDGKVPPGVYAEFGYILLIQGKNSEAITYFEKEKKLWPESARLMNTMLKTAKSAKNKKSNPTRRGTP
ncbi:MAG: DUF4810 domain-containing protein [Nitrospinae bacterium]|nr:DUF4810 domain-containing protein [Nitrospinota bacterium]